MTRLFPLSLAAVLAAGLCAGQDTSPAVPSAAPEAAPEAAPTVAEPEALPSDPADVSALAKAPMSALREALNDVSDRSIEASRHARDLRAALEAAIVDSTISNPEVDAARARREEAFRAFTAAENALREAILRSPEMKERAAEAEAAAAEAEGLAARRRAIRALLAQRRGIPAPASTPAP